MIWRKKLLTLGAVSEEAGVGELMRTILDGQGTSLQGSNGMMIRGIEDQEMHQKEFNDTAPGVILESELHAATSAATMPARNILLPCTGFAI